MSLTETGLSPDLDSRSLKSLTEIGVSPDLDSRSLKPLTEIGQALGYSSLSYAFRSETFSVFSWPTRSANLLNSLIEMHKEALDNSCNETLAKLDTSRSFSILSNLTNRIALYRLSFLNLLLRCFLVWLLIQLFLFWDQVFVRLKSCDYFRIQIRSLVIEFPASWVVSLLSHRRLCWMRARRLINFASFYLLAYLRLAIRSSDALFALD